MSSLTSRRLSLNDFAPIFVLVATFIAYAAVSVFGFVYDDEAQIIHNSSVQHWRFIPAYFNMHVWQWIHPHVAGNYYRPAFLAWLLLNFKAFGLHAPAWHLANLALHLLVTWLVYRLALRLLHDQWAACATALVFGLHPVHIEAVAWISGSTETLAAVFILCVLLAYIRFREERSTNQYGLVLLWFAFALLTKETAVLLPVLLLAYDVIILRGDNVTIGQRTMASLRRIAPMFAMIGIYLVARYHALHGLSHRMEDVTLAQNLLTIPSLLVFYARLLFYPLGLSAFYDTQYVNSVDAALLPTLAVVAVAGALAYLLWRTRSRVGAFAAVFIIVPLLPLMKLDVFIRGEIAHDRYLYLPSIGFALLLGLAVRRLAQSDLSRLGYGALAGLAIGYCAGTMVQSLYWADNLVLYARGVEIAPENLIARNDLANEFLHRGNVDRAMQQYHLVLERDPSFWLARYNLGYSEYKTGDCTDAVHDLDIAARQNATDAESFFYLGECRARLGKVQNGIALMRHGIELEPRMPNFRAKLADVLASDGDKADLRAALDLYRIEAKYNPSHPYAARRAAEVEAQLSR